MPVQAPRANSQKPAPSIVPQSLHSFAATGVSACHRRPPTAELKAARRIRYITVKDPERTETTLRPAHAQNWEAASKVAYMLKWKAGRLLKRKRNTYFITAYRSLNGSALANLQVLTTQMFFHYPQTQQTHLPKSICGPGPGHTDVLWLSSHSAELFTGENPFSIGQIWHKKRLK